MNWSSGFSAEYYASIVDPNTWRDINRFEITGGSITRNDSELRESADIECLNYTEVTEQWIRIWLNAKQGNDTAHIALFTGLTSTPSRNINGRIVNTPIQCYSVLKPAQDVLLDRGWYVPADMDGAKAVEQLLKVVNLPIDYYKEEVKLLSSAIIAEDGETHLSMAEKILEAIDWDIFISGDGSIYLGPYEIESTAIFDSINNDIVEKSLTINYDWFDCPNVFRAIVDNVYAIARDDDPNSSFSTVSRGREIWAEETNCDLNQNETIGEYAQRKLNEKQNILRSISYSRRFDPNVNVYDVITLSYPEQNIFGTFRVRNQTIELGHGARTSEEVIQI